MSNAARNKELAQLRGRALTRAKRMIKSVAGIKGVDFGWVYKDGVRTSRRGVRFHVKEKRPLTALASDQVLPEELVTVPCDVIEASYQLHAPNPHSLFDPIRPGISTGNVQHQTTGTLGLIVSDLQDGVPCLLSNWHVLCGSPLAQAGEAISQPGPNDLGSMPARTVAQLLRWTKLSTGYDAALASITAGASFDKATFGTALAPFKVSQPKLGMRLVKCGVTSGVTHAIVDGIDGSYEMDYTSFGDQVRWMDGIRLVPDPSQPEDEISLEGDSGAMWIETASKAAVALHFGGEDSLGPLAEYAVAHPLPRVLELLDAALLH